MDALRELQLQIGRHCRGSQTETAVPGLTLLRSDTVISTPVQLVYRPMVCVIAQGRKQVMLNAETFRYDAAKYLISSVDLPVSSRVVKATPQCPYLALSLALDLEVLSTVFLEMAAEPPQTEIPRALAVTRVTPELLDGFVRLLRLLDRPVEIAPLAPLIVREILYRLLRGEQGVMLRQIALRESRTQQVVRAINWIRQNYAKPFRISALVRVSNMSAPSLHRHFKAVTAMSPLQYQKQIRLQEARRILVSERQDAASAGFSVGYGSPSQFSREYCRLFGAPPRQDAERLLRGEATAMGWKRARLQLS